MTKEQIKQMEESGLDQDSPHYELYKATYNKRKYNNSPHFYKGEINAFEAPADFCKYWWSVIGAVLLFIITALPIMIEKIRGKIIYDNVVERVCLGIMINASMIGLSLASFSLYTEAGVDGWLLYTYPLFLPAIIVATSVVWVGIVVTCSAIKDKIEEYYDSRVDVVKTPKPAGFFKMKYTSYKLKHCKRIKWYKNGVVAPEPVEPVDED
tara:strand:- start:1910 stop:2539 length:630 start_codon:yes stop_codon:yes gene_type:complete